MDVPPRVADHVDRYAASTPDAPALIDGDEALSYRELAERVAVWERALIASGVRHGDRVTLLSPPGNNFWVCFLATSGIGAIWIGLNPQQKYEELSYIVGDAEPCLVFSAGAFEGRSYADDIARLKREHSSLREIIALDDKLECGTQLATFLERGARTSAEEQKAARASVRRLDPALIVYTSGSTGKPKGAMLSHFAMGHCCAAQVKRFGIGPVRTLCYWPINHVAGTADTCGMALVSGGTAYFQPRFSIPAILNALRTLPINLFMGVPTMYQMIMSDPDYRPGDFKKLGFLFWGGAALPQESVRELAKLNVPMAVIWGLTEATANVTYTDPGASLDALCTSIGKPLPEFQLRIVDNGGNECPQGVAGEIQLKGDYCLLGYWRNPDATRDAYTEDGWMKTGDLAQWRPDGNLQFVSRIKEMFKSGGYNVYPREIEIALEECVGVRMAIVVPTPHKLYDEVGVAFVQREAGASLTEDDLRTFCKARLANYKTPKRFIVRDEFPMLAVGKVDKTKLKAEAASLELK